ncbi:DUF7144 family membrane protein [Peterkaempfera bronchialis]|uniref:DUF7144 family membrane protein n=1 Tax=Peterkaempfera bronchialis TaxID=2126346 RepID=UPI003C2FDB10
MYRDPSAGRSPRDRSPHGRSPAEPMPSRVAFASVMMVLLGTFLVIAAVTEWAGSDWLYPRAFAVFGSAYAWWAVFDLVTAVLAFYAAWALTGRQRVTGRLLALAFAVASAVRWMFFIASAPVLAVLVVIIDGVVIWGLTSAPGWFAQASV